MNGTQKSEAIPKERESSWYKKAVIGMKMEENTMKHPEKSKYMGKRKSQGSRVLVTGELCTECVQEKPETSRDTQLTGMNRSRKQNNSLRQQISPQKRAFANPLC